MPMMQIEPLSDVLGARVSGVDLAQALDAGTFSRIEATLHQQPVILRL